MHLTYDRKVVLTIAPARHTEGMSNIMARLSAKGGRALPGGFSALASGRMKHAIDGW